MKYPPQLHVRVKYKIVGKERTAQTVERQARGHEMGWLGIGGIGTDAIGLQIGMPAAYRVTVTVHSKGGSAGESHVQPVNRAGGHAQKTRCMVDHWYVHTHCTHNRTDPRLASRLNIDPSNFIFIFNSRLQYSRISYFMFEPGPFDTILTHETNITGPCGFFWSDSCRANCLKSS